MVKVVTMYKRLLVLAAVSLGLPTCGAENQPLCIPNERQSCFCETGAAGTMTCDPNGYDFSGCLCNPDAAVDGVDAEASQIDAAVPDAATAVPDASDTSPTL